MATKVITLKGIDVNSQDVAVEEGKCYDIVNLRCVDGKWMPIGDKLALNWLSPDYDAYHVHMIDTVPKYIFYDAETGELWFSAYGSSNKTLIANIGNNRYDVKFKSIGNTLVIFDETGIQYALYTNSGYNYLDMQVDVPNFYFTQQLDSGSYNIKFQLGTGVIESLSGLLEKNYNDWRQKGMFEGWVGITAALEMFDGTILKYSFPRLVYVGKVDIDLTSSLVAKWKTMSNTATIKDLKPGRVQYLIDASSSDTINLLQTKYKDLLKGVSIFMTKPISAYIADGYLDNMIDSHLTMSDKLSATEILKDKLFYKVQTLTLTSLDTATTHNVETGDLNLITAKETFKTDSFSMHKVGVNEGFAYNKRLFLNDVTTKFYDGFDATTFFPVSQRGSTYNIYIDVEITSENGKRIVRSAPFGANTILLNIPLGLSYPDYRATRVYIVATNVSTGVTKQLMTTPMIPHPLYNWAVANCNEYSLSDLIVKADRTNLLSSGHPISLTQLWDSCGSVDHSIDESVIRDSNKLIVSDVNNPFYFNAKSSYQVGNGTIIKLESYAEPISQGQFGAYPVIAFCSDGTYVLNLGITAAIDTVRLLTADKLLSKNSICHVELHVNTEILQAIAFATNEGIKVISRTGSNIISKPLHYAEKFPLYEDSIFIKTCSKNIDDVDTIVDLFPNAEKINFFDFLANSILAYDNTKHELIVSSALYNFSYIYNLKYQVWTRVDYAFSKFITALPVGLGILNANVNRNITSKAVLYTSESSVNKDVLVVTRPISVQFGTLCKITRSTFIGNTFVSTNKSFLFAIYNTKDRNVYNISSTVNISQDFQHLTLGRQSSGLSYIVLLAGNVESNTIFSTIDYEAQLANSGKE